MFCSFNIEPETCSLLFSLVLFTLIVHKRHYLLIQLLKNTQTDNYEAKHCNDSTWLRVRGENKFVICFCFSCKTWLACYATTFQPVGSQPHAGNVRRAEQRKLHKSFQSEKIRFMWKVARSNINNFRSRCVFIVEGRRIFFCLSSCPQKAFFLADFYFYAVLVNKKIYILKNFLRHLITT